MAMYILTEQWKLITLRIWKLQKRTRLIPVQPCQPKRSATNKDTFDSWARGICYLLLRWLWANIWKWPWSSYCRRFDLFDTTEQLVPLSSRPESYHVSNRNSGLHCQRNRSFRFWEVRKLYSVTERKRDLQTIAAQSFELYLIGYNSSRSVTK